MLISKTSLDITILVTVSRLVLIANQICWKTSFGDSNVGIDLGYLNWSRIHSCVVGGPVLFDDRAN